jgi:pimeloyl-ACP methyl ester carboxylesterase
MNNPNLTNHIVFKGGQGSPVVFLHGIEDDGTFWYPVDRSVAEFREVLTIDLLGFGGSDKHDALKYTLAEHVEAIKNTIQAEFGIQKVTVVAHSLGCYTALEYARIYPERVQRLILSSPVIILDTDAIKPKDFFELLQMFSLTKIGRVRKAVLSRAESKSASPALKKAIKTFWPSIKNIETLVEKQDVPSQILDIKNIPIVINYGALDPLVINSGVEQVIAKLPNVTINKFGVSHDVVHFRPVELLKEIVPEIKEKEIPDLIYKKRHRIKLG